MLCAVPSTHLSGAPLMLAHHPSPAGRREEAAVPQGSSDGWGKESGSQEGSPVVQNEATWDSLSEFLAS